MCEDSWLESRMVIVMSVFIVDSFSCLYFVQQAIILLFAGQMQWNSEWREENVQISFVAAGCQDEWEQHL